MEVAAGSVVAEQVISTTLEAGVVAGYGLAKSTMPLKATFTQIASTPDAMESSDSLSRRCHTVNVVNGKAYIFGGIAPNGSVAGNEMHIVTLPVGTSNDGPDFQYKCVPALSPLEGNEVPQPRAGHSACTCGDSILVYGGTGDLSTPLDEAGRIWAFDTVTLEWKYYSPTSDGPPMRFFHAAVMHDKTLVVHGGMSDSLQGEAWSFDLTTKTWTQLPSLPSTSGTSTPPPLAISNGSLYTITGSSETSSELHILDLSTPEASWHTITFPTNPLIPGPKPRHGASLIHISTGLGREYLLYLMGSSTPPMDAKTTGFRATYSDLWTLQLPSTPKTLASVKDVTREKLGTDSGEVSWAEVEVKPRVEETAPEGKSHPGPLALFGCTTVDRKTVLLWGGVDAKGESTGDGWVVRLE